MTKKEKVSYIQAALEKLYPKTPIPLDHYSNYTLLVAVVLSAQCTDARVNTITPILFKKADTPQKMAKLSVKEIADIIRPCGLTPMKSTGIKGLSEIICNQYNGEVPDSYEALESLPSVGHKTASVVMSQGFNHPAFPVDTHIHRLMKRWGLSNGSSVLQTEKDAKLLFPKEKWNKLHLQIIFYGREYSPARGVKKEIDYITMNVGRKSVIASYK
jgi:endonuclease-3